MIPNIATEPSVVAAVALATIVSGAAPIAQWISRLIQVRKVDRIAGQSNKKDSAKFTIPPLGRSVTVDLNFDAVTSRKVSIGVMPFVDHTQAFIAQRLGWFEEAGIRPIFRKYTPETVLDALEKGEVDIVSLAPSTVIKRGSNPHNVQAFVLHDLFVGYGLMTRQSYQLLPPRRVRSYSALRERGMTHDESVETIAGYVGRRRIAHAKDDAIEPFIYRIASSTTPVKRFNHLHSTEMGSVRAVVMGEATFQVGGVPSRLTLERLGFRALLSSRDLLEHGVLLQDSTDYQSVIQCGWFASKEWINRSPDLTLRLASVSYRVSRFIVDNPELAAAIHVEYLNELAGTALTSDEVCRAYREMHPFKSFEEQSSWFCDASDPFYFVTVTENIIEHWKRILPAATFQNIQTTTDIIVADQWHSRLLALRRECIERMRALQRTDQHILAASGYRAASKYFYSYNYLDCLDILTQLGPDATEN